MGEGNSYTKNTISLKRHCPAMGYRCMCTTRTVRHKAEVQSKSQRGKLFSDIS